MRAFAFDPALRRALTWLSTLGLVLLALALLALPTEPVSAVPTPVAQATLSVSVRAAEAPQGPLAHAELVLFQLQGEQYVQVGAGTTDSAGAWRAALPEGVGWLVARAPGRARAAVPYRVLREQPSTPLELMLAVSRSLAVEVRAEDEQGELRPLAAATVLMGEVGALPWGGRTAADGRWAATDVPAGPVRVQVFARGYEPFLAETDADLLVRLRPVMTLRVHVRDGGKPVSGAEVHLSGLSLWPARVVETGAHGDVDVQGLAAGDYALYAEKGERISPQLVGVEVLGERGQKEITLELGPGRFIDVKVVSDLEAPIPKAQLTFSLDGLDEFVRRAEADGAGHARLGPLGRADGLVHAVAPGFVDRVVPAAAGELIIVLERAGSIVGRVIDDRGFPVEGAELQVLGTDNHGMPVFVRPAAMAVQSAHFEWAVAAERRLIPAGELGVMLGPVPPLPLAPRAGGGGAPAATFVSDARGRFRIDGVPPGQIVVLGRHPNFLDGKSAARALAPGGQAEVEVVLGHGDALRGRVVDDRAFPVSDARVTATGRGFQRQVAVLEDGSFELSAAPRDVTLSVTRLSRPLRVVLEQRLTARKPEQELLLTLPPPRQSSRLRVLDERGDGVPLAQVRLISKIAREPIEETRFSDEHGELEFDDVRGLSATLEIKAPGFVDQESPLVLAAENTLHLVRALTVLGRVTTARGRLPASNAEIVLEFRRTERRTRANDAGEYRLTGIPAGPVTLRASHPEHGQGKLPTTVQEGVGGREANLPDLDLVPGVVLSGRVVDARGFPVANAWISAQPLSVYLPASGGVFDAVQADENGEFELVVPAAAELVLYAVAPAQAGGWVRLSGTQDHIDDVEIQLDERDAAPAEELGSVLISLSDKRGSLEIVAVARRAFGPALELERGDRILEIEHEQPRDLADARALLSGTVGSEVHLVVQRGGREREILVSREAFLR